MTTARRGFEELRKYIYIWPGVGVNYGLRGRGLFIEKSSILAGEKILEIPREAWWPLSAEAFQRSAPSFLVKRLDEFDQRALARGRLTACALCTLGLIYGDKDSLKSAYLDTLPDTCETWNPSLWNTEELNELESSSAKRKATSFRHLCEETVSYLGLQGLSSSNYTRFACLVRSRALSFERNGHFFFTLMPALDLVNHEPKDPTARLELLYQEDSSPTSLSSVKLIANRDLYRGDEITFSYGPISNAKLLSIYGFALDENEDDAVYLYPEDLSEFYKQEQKSTFTRLVASVEARRQLRNDPSDNKALDIITKHSGLPEQALANLRAHFLNTEDRVNIQSRGGDSGVPSTQLPVTARNERLALQALRDICEYKLEYQTASIEDDLYFLNMRRSQDDIRHHIVRTRLGEKLIWKHTINLTEEALSLLGGLSLR
mmetsp:Transcript_19674/g.29881  ORF Transcript_19674/g.29881 Transcript_19674/m.29881 type:complete len:432 (+) Transcript_19674:52-1347(+)